MAGKRDPQDQERRESDIVKEKPRLEEVIARRREHSAVRSGYIELLIRIAVAALVIYLLLTYAFLITQNNGQAMFPAMKDGDLCIIFRQQTINLLGEKYEAGDIVAYQVEGKRHFGRVVAIGGDSVQIDTGGSVTVNGVTESEEILYPTYTRGDLLMSIINVNDGTLYVLGDYRINTEDSRDFGPIPLDDVEGKVISILRRRGL